MLRAKLATSMGSEEGQTNIKYHSFCEVYLRSSAGLAWAFCKPFRALVLQVCAAVATTSHIMAVHMRLTGKFTSVKRYLGHKAAKFGRSKMHY